MVITIILFVIVILGEIYLFKRLKPEEKKIETPKISKEERKKQEQIRSAFENLMKYDEETAMKRR